MEDRRHHDHQVSAQQKCTIPTLAQPALLMTCHQPGVTLVSVMEWSVGDIPIPSKYTNIILKKVKHNSNTNKYPSSRSCAKFESNGTFTPLPVSLVEDRAQHLCWSLPSGEVLLLGGSNSDSSTERVSADGSSSSEDFKLSSTM